MNDDYQETYKGVYAILSKQQHISNWWYNRQ